MISSLVYLLVDSRRGILRAVGLKKLEKGGGEGTKAIGQESNVKQSRGALKMAPKVGREK